MGVAKTYDLSLSTQISLAECYEEFIAQYRNSAKYEIAKECLEALKGKTEEEMESILPDLKKKLEKAPSSPVLCSECPGWICYAEKVVGEEILPFMSLVKSTQQIQGRLLKSCSNTKLFTGEERKDTPANIMHI